MTLGSHFHIHPLGGQDPTPLCTGHKMSLVTPTSWTLPLSFHHLLFDGKHGESNGDILLPELLIQDVNVEGPLPDDGGQPRGQDKDVFPTAPRESHTASCGLAGR